MGLTISPRPDKKAVPPSIKKGTSEPTSEAISYKESLLKFKSHRIFNKTNTAAASLLPPPNPEAIGMPFTILIEAPTLISPTFCKSRAA